MSFAALLAGDSRSNGPLIASRAIRRFAIPINGSLPAALLQRLRLFVPRIIGTQDRLGGMHINALGMRPERQGDTTHSGGLPDRDGKRYRELLMLCGRAAPYLDIAVQRWSTAIDLLDRLCDIRGETAALRVGAVRITTIKMVP